VKRGHLARVVGALYPRAWKRRYGKELADLCDEYLREGESTPLRLALGVTASALGERRRVFASRPWKPLLATAVILMAIATTGFATNAFGLFAGSRSAPASHKLSASHLHFPINLPPPVSAVGAITLLCNGKEVNLGKRVTLFALESGRVVLPRSRETVRFDIRECNVPVDGGR
jgi:hypothetical protein